MKQWSFYSLIALLILAGLLLNAPTVQAEAGLQLNPLKYEDVLSPERVKAGFIDVANPSDTTVIIHTDVQGFRQVDLDGNLQFFADEQLRAGIRPALEEFELGPRESVRVAFNVDPGKLPQGGVYAAIFFRTAPPPPTSPQVSYIAESANVGTLLILRNGTVGEQIGHISSFMLPLWQFGRGLHGQLQYRNTNRDTGGVAFTPQLTSRVTPWGQQRNFAGPFIMPQNTRQLSFERPGSYLGLLPITVTDAHSGHGLTRWVIACTGWYQGVVLALVAGLIIWWIGYTGRGPRLRQLPRVFRRLWHRFRRRPTARRPMDGLGPKAK